METTTKESRIKREIARLRRAFKNLDKNKLETVKNLIETAAFMYVSLDELQVIINEEGYTEEYNNGGGQTGRRQSEAVKTHIAITKNFTAVMRTLADLAPPKEAKRDGRWDALNTPEG